MLGKILKGIVFVAGVLMLTVCLAGALVLAYVYNDINSMLSATPIPPLPTTTSIAEVEPTATGLPILVPTVTVAAPVPSQQPIEAEAKVEQQLVPVENTPQSEVLTECLNRLGWRNQQVWSGEVINRGVNPASIDILSNMELTAGQVTLQRSDGSVVSPTGLQLLGDRQQGCHTYVAWFEEDHGPVILKVDGQIVPHYDGWYGDSSTIVLP